MSGSATQASPKALIRARGLAIGYGGSALLERLDFEVPEGGITAILGGSGTGKSTLIKTLAGLLRPISGSLELHAEARRPGLRPGAPSFGMVFQGGALLGSMTLLQNVALPLQRWTDLPPAAIELEARAKLRLVGLSGFENHPVDALSGGMRKRAGVARGLALDPPLLFLDEPSAGLDPHTMAELDRLLIALNASLGITMVLVTHELASLFRIADNALLLERDARGIIARGAPRELSEQRDDLRVLRFFHPDEAFEQEASDLHAGRASSPSCGPLLDDLP
ncbi:MAG: ABC transporter ATP-binding protein [Planctomycetota bacterium]